MTGRYPITLGMQYGVVQEEIMWGLNESEVTLPQVLKENGDYITYGLGKWDLGYANCLFRSIYF